MLRILEDKKEIKKAQALFENKLKSFFNKKILGNVGYQGGSFITDVYYNTKYDIWVTFDRADNRFWNAFGKGKPSENESASITCEINIPFVGIDRRIGGTFAIDELNNIYVVYRGNIGGSREGIGKSLFIDNYRGNWITVKDGNKESSIALIGSMDSNHFSRQVANFVNEVSRIKSMSTNGGIPNTPDSDHQFNEEFCGQKKYKVEKVVKAKCDHGIIVNQLSKELSEMGYKVGNDRNRDLYIVNTNGTNSSIFEVKTDLTTTSIYTGVGQLMIHSCMLIEPNLFLVIPENIGEIVEQRLNQIGIRTIKYKWINGDLVFNNIKQLEV